MQRFKRISSRLLFNILPITVAALVAVAAVSFMMALQGVAKQVIEKMQAVLSAKENEITAMMQEAEVITDSYATMFGMKTDGSETSVMEFENVTKAFIEENDLIVAMGIFLDPSAWNGKVNYYWGEDNGTVSMIDVGEEPFTEKDWFISCKQTGEPFYTETYVDESLGILMTSYVVPIYNNAGQFVGCVNTDIDMSVIQEAVDASSFGETGRAMLISTEGKYLSGVEAADILNLNIADDAASGLGAVKDEVLANESGNAVFMKNGEDYSLYYTQIGNYDWILLMEISRDELNADIMMLLRNSLLVILVSVIICTILIILTARSIAKPIVAVKKMSEQMAQGDFSIDELPKKSQDEVGTMTEALNEMLVSNRNEMLSIAQNSNTVGENCNVLQVAVNELENGFEKIDKAIRTISSAMMDNSATTEELTASVAEIKETVTNLAEKATESEKMSYEIMDRAHSIEDSSAKSFDHTMNLSEQFEKRMQISIENAHVVNDIETMADAINEIAEQINLLSLNASIEAARAGEHGKGFAVVAGEIGNLASQTSQTVTNIQATVVKVKESVDNLANDSKELISFIVENVTPDYKSFVDVSRQYGRDATSIQQLATYVSDIASQLKSTMDDVNLAIQNIAIASQDAAEESTVILESVDEVSGQVENVGNISSQQKEISSTLDQVVSRYKLG